MARAPWHVFGPNQFLEFITHAQAGAGAIGLLATSVAKALGASRIMIADINEERLQLAKKMGADVLINCKETNLHQEVMRLTNGDGVPRLVEASGASALVNSSFKLLQKVQGGRPGPTLM